MSEKPESPRRYKEEKGEEKRREKEDEKRKGWDEKWRPGQGRCSSMGSASHLVRAGLTGGDHRFRR